MKRPPPLLAASEPCLHFSRVSQPQMLLDLPAFLAERPALPLRAASPDCAARDMLWQL